MLPYRANIMRESLSYYTELSTAVILILLLNLESNVEGLQDI